MTDIKLKDIELCAIFHAVSMAQLVYMGTLLNN